MTIWEVISHVNTEIDQKKPWDLAKEESKKKELKSLLQEWTKYLYNIATALEPFMPKISKDIIQIITDKQIRKPDKPLFPRLK